MRGMSLALLLMASMSHAEFKVITPPAQMKAKLAPLLAKINGAQFFETGSSLYGLAGKDNGGRAIIMYVDPSGEYFFSGHMFKANPSIGVKNLTVEALQQFSAETKTGKLANEYQQKFAEKLQDDASKQAGKTYQFTEAGLAALPYLQNGTGPVVVYAFVDPTLPSSKKAIQELTIFENGGGKGRLTFRWLPTSNGDLKSVAQAAAIHGTKDPLVGLYLSVSDTKKFEFTPEESAKGAMKLEQVMQYAKKLGVKSSPFFVMFQNGKMQYQDGYKGVTWFAR